MIAWVIYTGVNKAVAGLGIIPSFLDEKDPRPASQQIAANCIGGWLPMAGFTITNGDLHYPGDPPLKPIASTHLRDERITVYPYAWVVIHQRDGTFEVARCD